jgi:hypothetical protein
MSEILAAGKLGRRGRLFARSEAPNFVENQGPFIDSTRSLSAVKFPKFPKFPTRFNKFNHLGGCGFFAVSGGFRPRIAPMTAAVLGPLKQEAMRKFSHDGKADEPSIAFRQEQVRIHIMRGRKIAEPCC